MDLDYRVVGDTPLTPQDEREKWLAAPGFCQVFSDHMVTIQWNAQRGWHDATVGPFQHLPLGPTTSALHYGQAIFEAFKAYRQPDGTVRLFRPELNAKRFQSSARRMGLPELPIPDFLEATHRLIREDVAWVPEEQGKSFYLRPLMFASVQSLGFQPPDEVTCVVMGSPVGAYYTGDLRPMSVWVSENYSRAAKNGTGMAKCAGNYAGSMIAQQEAIENGCEQVLFIDAAEQRWVEELTTMNVMVVLENGTIVTPPVSGTILDGVTRASVIALAVDGGREVVQRPIGIDELRAGISSGAISEAFACGTAATIAPIGRFVWSGAEVTVADGACGPVTRQLRKTLLDIQYGQADGPRGWMQEVPMEDSAPR